MHLAKARGLKLQNNSFISKQSSNVIIRIIIEAKHIKKWKILKW